MTLLPWAQMGAEINTDLTQRVVQTPQQALWYESPAKDIHRRPLDRIGAEVAKATSIVRYLPGSQFANHHHGGGEEILVLEGIFSDEHGDYPAGTYLRNPPGTSHAPFSKQGCVLLVKLWQFSAGDTEQLCIRAEQQHWQPGLVPGLEVLPLHQFDGINTALVRWAPNTEFQPHIHAGGEEIYVLDGVFQDEFGRYPKDSWIRSPRWSKHQPFTSDEGALIYVKVGHLGALLLGDQLKKQN